MYAGNFCWGFFKEPEYSAIRSIHPFQTFVNYHERKTCQENPGDHPVYFSGVSILLNRCSYSRSVGRYYLFSTGNKSVEAPLFVWQHQFSWGLISGGTLGSARERSGDSARWSECPRSKLVQYQLIFFRKYKSSYSRSVGVSPRFGCVSLCQYQKVS
jgi:hypothetical protein